MGSIGRFWRWLLEPSPADATLGAERKRAILVRAGFFVIAMCALLTASRAGTGLPTVATVLTGYVAAAVLWVRGQYAISIHPVERLWTPRLRLSVAGTGVAVIAFWVGFGQDNGSLVIGAIAGGYFFAGYAVMRLRVHAWGSSKAWSIALGVCALAMAIGVAIPTNAGALIVAGLGLASTVVVLGVLASRAIIALGQPEGASLFGRPWTRTQVTSSGVLALVLGLVVALVQVPNVFMAIGLVVLVLAIFGMVFNTYADIAVVIMVVALLGITPHSENFPPSLEPEPGDSNVLVALGDSYMAGEGAKVFYDGTDDGSNQCHRSPTSWAAMAGSRPPFGRMIFLACSGASTYNVRGKSMEPVEPDGPDTKIQYDEPGTQLDQYAKEEKTGLTPALVVLSLGGNDSGFSTIAAMCLAPGNCNAEGENLWTPNLPRLEKELVSTYTQVRDTVGETTEIVVVGYPDPIYDPPPEEIDKEGLPPQECGNVALSRGDRDFVKQFLADLNATVEAATKQVEGFTYLAAMASSLEDAGLQLCDPRNENRPGLNFIGLRSVDGIAEQRFDPGNWYHNSLHPNERGHAAMLATFETWVADRTSLAGPSSDPPSETDEPTCDPYTATGGLPTCDSEATDWIAGEVRKALTVGLWGLVLLLVTGGAWLIAVSFFGWRVGLARAEHDDPRARTATWWGSLFGTWRARRLGHQPDDEASTDPEAGPVRG